MTKPQMVLLSFSSPWRVVAFCTDWVLAASLLFWAKGGGGVLQTALRDHERRFSSIRGSRLPVNTSLFLLSRKQMD